jgi:hypothetical protein
MNQTSSLADFLRRYRQQHPEDIFPVDEEVDVEYEPTAYYKLLEEKNPLIWFFQSQRLPGFSTCNECNGLEV